MREYFLERIYGEYQSYKASVLEENSGAIYARCYEIDCMINIYEILKEFAMKLSDEELRTLMNYRNILNYFYELWLKKTDSQYAEMERHVAAEMKKLFSDTGKNTERIAA